MWESIHLFVERTIFVPKKKFRSESHLEHEAGVPVVHGLVAAALVAALVQSAGDVLHRHVREGGRVALLAQERRHLPGRCAERAL
eukprot:1800809-Pyramimonas_sp.AAC.1